MKDENLLKLLENGYFKAVNLNSEKEEKLQKIVQTFTKEGKIIDSKGQIWSGSQGIYDFYSSNYSPVTKKGFTATPFKETTSVSSNGFIAVQILLKWETGAIRVGDWFKMDGNLIQELHIFAGEPLK